MYSVSQLDWWLRMVYLPHRANFADISYLNENFKLHWMVALCALGRLSLTACYICYHIKFRKIKIQIWATEKRFKLFDYLNFLYSLHAGSWSISDTLEVYWSSSGPQLDGLKFIRILICVRGPHSRGILKLWVETAKCDEITRCRWVSFNMPLRHYTHSSFIRLKLRNGDTCC